MVKKVMASGQEIHWPWQVVLVSKNFIFVVCVCFTLECWCSEIITVSVFLLGSNYEKKYHQHRYHVPQRAAQTWRTTPMGQKTQWPCLLKVSHAIRHKSVYGDSNHALGEGYCGLFRGGEGPQASMCMACCPNY